MSDETKTKLTILQELLSRTLDTERTKAAEKRHKAGYRTARENLTDLVDADSFIEYGQLAVAAQRNATLMKICRSTRQQTVLLRVLPLSTGTFLAKTGVRLRW